MAISIVQSAASKSATTNPTVRLNGVAASNILVLLVAQFSAQLPGLPTDSVSDAWVWADNESWVDGISIGLYLASAKGGTTTITMPTVAESLYAVAEVNGALAGNVQNPDCLSSMGYVAVTPTLSFQTSNAKGALWLGMCATRAVDTFTVPTGWTSLASVTGTSISASIVQRIVTAPSSDILQWTQSSSQGTVAEGIGLGTA